jgi:hypothetical protein
MDRPVLSIERYELLTPKQPLTEQDICGIAGRILGKLVTENYPEFLTHNPYLVVGGVVVYPLDSEGARPVPTSQWHMRVPPLGLDMRFINGQPLQDEVPGYTQVLTPGFYVVVWRLQEVACIPFNRIMQAANSFVAILLQKIRDKR